MAFAPCFKRLVLMTCGACAVLGTAHVCAQAVLDERTLNESAVVKALEPDGVVDSTVRTRGFVVVPEDPSSATASAYRRTTNTARPGVASILISFASNSSQLTPAAKTALDEVGKAMRSEQLAAYRFQIEGHADPRGSFNANMRLSAERAQAVAFYLSSAGGVAPERLKAVGKGSTEPMYPRNPGAPENRRVTIVTLK
jgi:hypothetical protein